MNNAAQIRRCSGALQAKHSRLQPPFLSPPPARRPSLKISNRESLRLEINVTQTKQKIQPKSNREESHAFQITINPPTLTARGCSQLNPQIPNLQPHKKAKIIKNHPQSLFRLEPAPTLHFQQLMQNLNEPMFRLEPLAKRMKNERTGNPKMNPPHPTIHLTCL
jgi:hypothetical protein